VHNEIKKIENPKTKQIISVILSRTIRSCRATTHADLATLLEPITTTYYCSKHGIKYANLYFNNEMVEHIFKDTVIRLRTIRQIKKKHFHTCLTGDSRTIDIVEQMKNINPEFSELIKNQKIKGIFSSPPYVGLIDYHSNTLMRMISLDSKDKTNWK